MTTMLARLPGPDITPQQLRERSWWSGPEVMFLVDDYDLVATPRGNPLSALVEIMPQAKDIGFQLVVTRRSGGASRAMYDTVLQRMNDLGSAGLLMSGSKDEGALLGGVRMMSQPPGRGYLIRRGSSAGLVQLAWRPPRHE
jgi:DNA segregation ATPase FtsK/SpoIIIE, S-DNA-T family